MSDDQQTEATATETEEAQQQDQAPKPTETVEFWKQKAREQERRAKENADARRRLSEIEDAQKSEADKAAERLAEAERKAAEAEARVLRREVALEHKLKPEDAALLDAVTDEEAMRALALRLAGGGEDKPKNHAPREGANPRPGEDELAAFARGLFGRAKAL